MLFVRNRIGDCTSFDMVYAFMLSICAVNGLYFLHFGMGDDDCISAKVNGYVLVAAAMVNNNNILLGGNAVSNEPRALVENSKTEKK